MTGSLWNLRWYDAFMTETEIDEKLAALREFWVRYPDWRITQLVLNVATWEPPAGKIKTDPFSLPDEDFFAKLEKYPYV